MINVSTEFKNELLEGNRKFNKYATITLKDGTVLDVDDSQIWENGFKFSGGSTESGNFTIGTVIVGKFILMLNNVKDEFTQYDFDEATVEPFIGLQLSEREEILRKGNYTVDEPIDNATIITLECLDNMSRFDKPFTGEGWNYPIKAQDAVYRLCMDSNVALTTTVFDGGDLYITEPFKTENNTYRQVLAYIMQYTCKFAYLDGYGRLSVKFYDKDFGNETDYDGGVFDNSNPYSTGDSLDGGSMSPWTSGDNADGGEFGDRDDYHHFFSMKGLSHATQDVVITGVSITEEFEETEELKRQTVLFGEPGYVIAISANPIITSGMADSVASFIGQRLVGMRFRPMSFQVIGDPTVEQGDSMIVTDRKGKQYKGYVTNFDYTLGSMQSISCDAETVRAKNESKVDPYDRIISEVLQNSKNETSKQISDYDKMVQQLTELVTKSFGSFKTEEILQDGSVIYYMHDKPRLEESMTVWKQTSDTFTVSTDGGKTWNAGIDSSGNAVLNVLGVIGLNADWINAGQISSVTININDAFIVDKDGNVTIKAGNITGYAADDDIKQLVATSIVEYIVHTSATSAPSQDASGWSSNTPTWTTGKYIWSRTKTTQQDGQIKYSNPVNIQGADGSIGEDGRGISSITPEYYLSTSKYSTSGGSWSTTAPNWVEGKYLWTRSKIIYTNPTATEYTNAFVDTTWEAVEQLENKVIPMIEANTDGISLRITQSQLDEDLARIGLDADTGDVDIIGNKLLVNSTNFKLSKDGTMEAKNAKFTGTVEGSEILTYDPYYDITTVMEASYIRGYKNYGTSSQKLVSQIRNQSDGAWITSANNEGVAAAHISVTYRSELDQGSVGISGDSVTIGGLKLISTTDEDGYTRYAYDGTINMGGRNYTIRDGVIYYL